MKTIATLLAAGLTLAATSAIAQDSPSERSQAKLARMLEGRVAGEPVRCINALRSDNLQVIDRVGVVYDAGSTVYLARAENPEALRDRDILIVERFGSSLCRNDVRQTVDRTSGHMVSVVFLTDFVPYRRAG
jgi:hypothetical protein